MIDIGLLLDDVEAMGLQSEPVSVTGWEKREATLSRHGATEEEIDFLEKERVELNAMTSPELIAFIEEKLELHGVEKLMPDEGTLQEHARRLIEQQLAAAAVRKLKVKLQREAATRAPPADLSARIEALFEERPELAWDTALAAGATDSASAGATSPGATIHAMVRPTGTSAPSVALIPARIPSAGASTSTTALSVSISTRGSPFETRSPSFFRQASSLPVSCAISRAGMTTLNAIVIFLAKGLSSSMTPSLQS